MTSRIIVAIIAVLWMVATVAFMVSGYYFRATCMALALLSAIFGVIWFVSSQPVANPPPSTSWLWTYAFPVVMAIFATAAFIAFSIDITFGLMIIAFEAGMIAMGWIFADWSNP